MAASNLKQKAKSEVVSWIKSIAIALVLALLIRQFLYTPVMVSGESMEPTFEHANRIVISKIHTIDRSDMIVFKSPYSEEDFIKRVIGLPGDIVTMKDDHLYINGIEYEEDYVAANKENIVDGESLTEDFEVEVPAGHYYVLGDNRRNSTDSRAIGFIDEASVIGKVSFRFYPFKSIGIPK